MDYSQFDDGALIQLMIDARTDALNELYSRYSRLIFTVASRIVGERSTAEEVTLDVFTKAWQKATTYRADRGNVRVWLTSMARNQAIDVLRRKTVRVAAQQKLWAESSNDPRFLERLPESAVDLRWKKERVRSAVGQLKEEQRDLLALAYFQGYTQSQIAQLRNLPLGTVKTRIRAGIQVLRQMLNEEHFN